MATNANRIIRQHVYFYFAKLKITLRKQNCVALSYICCKELYRRFLLLRKHNLFIVTIKVHLHEVSKKYLQNPSKYARFETEDQKIWFIQTYLNQNYYEMIQGIKVEISIQIFFNNTLKYFNKIWHSRGCLPRSTFLTNVCVLFPQKCIRCWSPYHLLLYRCQQYILKWVNDKYFLRRKVQKQIFWPKNRCFQILKNTENKI